MTRPHIIRADTIDLQNTENPSAKDHSRQPARPAPLGVGPLAPHQSQEIRKVENETNAVPPSPRAPGEQGQDPYNSDLYGDSDEDDLTGNLQHDTQAGQLNGGMVSEEDGMDDDDDLDDDLMDKISSSPSIDDEDIDFEFVYALHTFVATVEGQANATKGDTMVLLDDSNSYWWLVRVVKDGSIGYLPAEHIETPTERLARLNKHRNIDLSATMLGDNPEKSKNPLKKAMRRRNAKTVQFTAPTYFEPSDNEYSSDEEEDEMGHNEMYQHEEAAEQVETQDEQHDDSDVDVIEPLNIKANSKPASQGQASNEIDGVEDPSSPEKSHNSEEGLERNEGTPSKSRNGTVRNTDSFFKDDNVETKKISLTPNLLRDDSANALDSKELKTRGSSDSFEKIIASGGKEDKKRKEKKGMLSGLFKRKDKKGKSQDEDAEDPEKISAELSRSSPQPKESYESISTEAKPAKPQARPAPSQSPQRQASKLQKAPPAQISPTKNETLQSREPQRPDRSPPRAAPASREIGIDPASQPVIQRQDSANSMQDAVTSGAGTQANSDASNAFKPKTAILPTLTTNIKPALSPRSDPQPERADKQAAAGDAGPTDAPQFAPPSEPPRQRSPEKAQVAESLDESPIHVSPMYSSTSNNPPDLVRDSSSVGEPAVSPISPSSSPDILGASDSKSANATPTSSTTPSVWSDASLRAYMDDGSDIRDLMMIVHDVSNVTPAPPDHPLLVDLFQNERRQLADMQDRLDHMMVDFWEKRNARRSAERSRAASEASAIVAAAASPQEEPN